MKKQLKFNDLLGFMFDTMIGLIGLGMGFPTLVLLAVYLFLFILGQSPPNNLDITLNHVIAIGCLILFLYRQRRYWIKLFQPVKVK